MATRRIDQGWFAEFKIPFSTLKFPSTEEQIWGINFERIYSRLERYPSDRLIFGTPVARER
ncbi:MAG: hypothetical protein ACE5G1_05945 [bacterium]